MKIKDNYSILNIQINTEVYNKLKEEANQEEVSLAALVRKILRDYYKK